MKKMMLGGLLLVASAAGFAYLFWGMPVPGEEPASAQEPDTPAENDDEDETSPGSAESDDELGAVPDGTLTDSGLEFIVPYDRGEGKLVLSRQNEMLRADVLVRLPYSAGDGNQSRGSSLNLSLTVDGRHGRHLFFFPDPVWAPDGQGNFPAYRWEASFKRDGDLARLNTEPSFACVADVKHWAKWEVTMWIDLRYVLIPGNSPAELAETWRLNMVAGNQAATVIFPSGVNLQNPALTPERMLTFKYSELPEREELDEDPREKAIETEEDVHERMKGIEAELMTRNPAGAFERITKALETYPGALWAHFLDYQFSMLASGGAVEGVPSDYLPRQKKYVEACPGQSSAHLAYLDALLELDKFDDALAHAKEIFDSPLCTERKATDGYMRLEWATRLIRWGYADEAGTILAGIGENEELLKRDNFHIDYRFQLAALAERRGESEKAAEIYQALLVEEAEHLDGEQMQRVQSLLQFQKEAAETWKDELKARKEDAEKKNPRMILETSKGKIVIELFEDDAPNTVASMVKLTRNEFYNGLNFHRVEPGFVAQGGCPNGNGSGSPGYRLKYEENDRKHFRGTFAMARAQPKDSAGCQFFICLSNGPNVINLNDNYVVAGRVIEGMDVADRLRVGDRIVLAEVENLRDHEYEPETLPDMK